MEQHNCLNCGTKLAGAFCHHCGQKGDTHRLTMKHLLAHDLIHGIWHLDKGILFTLRETLVRPGVLATNYIAGKRTGHFNLVTLLVLLTTIFLFTTHHADYSKNNFKINGTPAPQVIVFIATYAKWLMLIAVPVMAVASRKILKRLGYNRAEHLVMCGYFVAGALCIMIAFKLLYLIPGVSHPVTIIIELIAVLTYLGFAFRQVMLPHYTTAGSIWRYIATMTAFTGYFLALSVGVLIIYYYGFM